MLRQLSKRAEKLGMKLIATTQPIGNLIAIPSLGVMFLERRQQVALNCNGYLEILR